VDKKNWIIISLSLVIIILVFIKSTGDSEFKTIIEQISGQRNDAIRSAEIIKYENSRIRTESAILRKNYIETEKNNLNLETENSNYRRIIEDIRRGSKKTDRGLGEYGKINREFNNFIRQFGTEE